MDITGAYVRIQDEAGRWRNLDIAELTPKQIDQLAKSTPAKGWVWVKFLVAWIQKNVRIEPAP